MTKILIKDVKMIKEMQSLILENVESLEAFLQSLYNQANDYSLDRNDAWYDTESCNLHYAWEERIESKINTLKELKANVSNLSFSDIHDRKFTPKLPTQLELVSKLTTITSDIITLSNEQINIQKELEKRID